MAEIKGAGFSLTVPDDYEDGTVYTFLLPALMPKKGKIMPHVVVHSEAVAADLDLGAHLAALREKEAAALPELAIIDERIGKRGGRDAATWLLEWGPERARMRQRRAYVLMRDPSPRLFSLLASDSAEHFAESEPTFNRILGSLAFS